MKNGRGDVAFDNVSNKDRIVMATTLPVRLAQSFVEFNHWYVFPTMKLVKNWWAVGFVYTGFKESSILKMKDGTMIMFKKSNVNELISRMRSLGLTEDTKRKFKVKINGNLASLPLGKWKLHVRISTLSAVLHEFYEKPHKEMNVKGKIVVDIGAYMGETALYYVIIGKARRVYAYELFPFLSRLAQDNVRINRLTNRVKVFNEGIGGENGSIMISDSESSFGNLTAKHHKDKINIKLLSLDQVVKKFKIQNGALKIDCEGYEYEIFRKTSSNALQAFDTIHIEYHYGYLDLVERLENEGFRVKHTRPIINIKGFRKPMLNGDIIAVKAKRQERH